MKQAQQQRSPQLIIVSIMCAVLMTVVGQTLHVALQKNDYVTVQARGREYASDPPSLQAIQSTTPLSSVIENRIDSQKQSLNSLIGSLRGERAQSTQSVDKPPDSTPLATQTTSVTLPSYTSFAILQQKLSQQECKYPLPIDNNDPQFSEIIQWGLSHCLITVSSSQKVYPFDPLTNSTLRIIAQRAGFEVNMGYADNTTVSKTEFLSFIDALQQHHGFMSIPIISLSSQVTRGEYLMLLYKLFDGKRAESPSIPGATDVKPQVSQTQLSSGLQETLHGLTNIAKETIVQQTDVPQTLKHYALQYINTSWGDQVMDTSNRSGTIGINYDALSLTWNQLKNRLGRS